MLINLMLLIIILLSLLIIMTASIVSKKSNLDREKSSPFECGFSPFSSSRTPFSLRFFLLAIIFLVFDVEIAILLPIPVIMKNMSMMSLNMINFIFIFTLMVGLLHEWNYGSLEWSK